MIFKYIFLFYIGSSLGMNLGSTVLITGGTGFIGTHLVEKLLEQNHKVIVDNFDTSSNTNVKKYTVLKKLKMKNLQEQYPDLLTTYSVDITNKKALENIFSQYKIDVVCHLAGIGSVRSSIDDPVSCLTTNLIGTVHLFECMRKYAVHRCVFASSSSVYGLSEEKIFCLRKAVWK